METESYIIGSIVYGTLVMLLLAGANIYILFFHRMKMTEKAREIQVLEVEKRLSVFKSASEAEELERERIARNLHDEINLMLAVHKQILEKHAFDIESNQFDSDGYYNEIANIEKIREAVTACATNLVPAFLLKNGLISTLEDHIRQINSAGKLKARCILPVKENSDFVFDKQDDLNIYRICLELINNLIKHAFPTVLTLTISMFEKDLLIQIDHNGKKITDDDVKSLIKKDDGLGLKSIMARSLILKAKINYRDEENQPAITLSVPFTKNDGKLLEG